jgi:hypothetical protein
MVSEDIHGELVKDHLVPLVQALGVMAQESYYKSQQFLLHNINSNWYLRYPRFGKWVQRLKVELEVMVENHYEDINLERNDPERWLSLPHSGFQYLLRYKTPLDTTKIERWYRENAAKMGMHPSEANSGQRYRHTLARQVS